MSRPHEETEWRRETTRMTEHDRSTTETECQLALGMCGDKGDADDDC